MKKIVTLIALAAFASATSSAAAVLEPMKAKAPAPACSAVSKYSDSYDSEVAVEWFELLYDIVKAESTSPPAASRIYGISAVALYESVAAGGKHHRSLGKQLNELGKMPKPANKCVHWPTAANAALAAAIRGLYPASSPATQAAITALEGSFADEFSLAVPADVYAGSVAHGSRVAAAILAWAAGDGFATINNCPYVVPVGPGLWEPTPPAFVANPLQPCWGQLRPMVLASGSECAPASAPLYSPAPTSEMYALAQEVVDVRLGLTPTQITIAHYWADGAGSTGTPPGHWIAIVSQISSNDALSLMESAEAYARVGISVTDAFIACWNGKYAHNLLRPVTYIQDHVQPGWLPLLTTPPFPEHTSGHSTQSGASSTVLSDMFGTKAFSDTTHTDHGLVPAQAPRFFNSFDEAAEEAAVSRLYGGIHYRTGNDAGLAQGRCIGMAINSSIRFDK